MASTASQRIMRLQSLIEHPRTGAGERAAAQRMLDKILDKSRARPESGQRRYGARHDRGGRHASLSRIADMVHEDIAMARLAFPDTSASAQVAVANPIADAPAEVRIIVETPHDAGIVITVDNVPADWGWVDDGGVQVHSRQFLALVDALAEIMKSYNHDGVEKRFFGSVRARGETLAW